MSTRNRWVEPPVAAAAAVVVTLAYRAAYATELRGMPVFLAPVLDGAAHLEWARGILAGTWPGPEAYFRAPGYPYALSAALRILGDVPARVELAQLFAGAVVPGLVALLAGRLFGRAAAWLAGLGAAVYPTLAFFDAQLLAPALAVPLATAAVLASLAAVGIGGQRSRGVAAWVAAVLWSLAAIVRPPLLLPALALPLFLSGVPRWRRLVVALVVLAAPLAVTLRNAAVGDPVFIASQGGLNLYLGNGPQADGYSATFAEAPGAVGYRMLDAARAIAERDRGRSLRSAEVSRYWTDRTVNAVVADPGRWTRLLGRKALLFAHAREIPNNHDPVLFAEFLPALRLPGWSLWFPLAVLGAWQVRKRRDGLYSIAAIALVALTCVGFFVNARFRLPVVPVIVALGGGGLAALAAAARTRDVRRVAGGVGLIAVGVVLTQINPFGIPREASATSYVLVAEAELARGEPVRSLRWVERALEKEPGLYAARLAQVDLLGRMQRYGEALAVADRVLTASPDDPAMLQQSARLLDLTGRPAEALPRIERALRFEPGLPGAAVDRAVLWVRVGRVEEAARELRRIAASSAPSDAARARLVLREVESGTLAPIRVGPDR